MLPHSLIHQYGNLANIQLISANIVLFTNTQFITLPTANSNIFASDLIISATLTILEKGLHLVRMKYEGITWYRLWVSFTRSPNIPREMMLVMMPDVAWLNPPPLSATPLQEELIMVT